MKLIKKILFLAVVAALAWGALWVYESPYYALYNIHEGLKERDAVRVERYADLERMVKASADVVGALAKEKIGVNGTDAGSQLLGAIVGAVAGKVGDAASVQGAVEVRRAIQEGRMKPAIGPFVVDDDTSAVGALQTVGDVSLVDLGGHCNGHEATLRVIFEKRDTTGPLGRPRKSVLVGVDKGSLPELARACR